MIGFLVLLGICYLIYFIVSEATKTAVTYVITPREPKYLYRHNWLDTPLNQYLPTQSGKPITNEELDQFSKEINEAIEIAKKAITRDVVREATELYEAGKISESEYEDLINMAIDSGYLKDK